MVNVTNSFTYNSSLDLSNVYGSVSECSISFKEAIAQGCQDWKNQSTDAHDLYIILLAVVYLIGLIKNFTKWDLRITIFKGVKEGFLQEETLELLDIIRGILINIVFLRILQVWYIVNYVLVV